MFLAFRLYIGSGFFKVGLFFPRIHFYGHSIVHFTVTMVKVKTELVRAGVLAFFLSRLESKYNLCYCFASYVASSIPTSIQ